MPRSEGSLRRCTATVSHRVSAGSSWRIECCAPKTISTVSSRDIHATDVYLVPHPGHSCRCFSSCQCQFLVSGDLGLQAFVETHTLLPLERMSHMEVVRADEGFDLLSSDGRVAKVGST